MTRTIFRLATPEDLPDIRRLQAQFSAELHDPIGVMEGSHARSDFTVIEVAGEQGGRLVGMMSVMRAASGPLVVEQAFPDLWAHVDLPAVTGRAGIGRDDLVEGDWIYLEKAYRRKHLALALWAGSVLAAHHRGFPVLIGMANPDALARMGDVFRTIGPAVSLAGVRHELGLIFTGESAPRLIAIVRAACARDPGIEWRLPGLEADSSAPREGAGAGA